jgi:site-specific DNA recombinase
MLITTEKNLSEWCRKRRYLIYLLILSRSAFKTRSGETQDFIAICCIYEDKALEKLTDERYAILDAQYTKEQSDLNAEILSLEKAIEDFDKNQKSADKFISLIDKYKDFNTLTNTMLNEFVEKILVHERDRKGCRETTQQVEIYFNFVGKFVPPHYGEAELTEAEK